MHFLYILCSYLNLNLFTGSERKFWTPEKNFQYAHEVSNPPIETDWGYFLQVCLVSFIVRVISTVDEGVVLPHRCLKLTSAARLAGIWVTVILSHGVILMQRLAQHQRLISSVQFMKCNIS